MKAGTAGATHTLTRSSPMAGTETRMILLLLELDEGKNQNIHEAVRFGGSM
jgi:hypothetical protein